MLDNDTRRLVTIFQNVFSLNHLEPDQAKYVKRHAGFIERTGQLFEYLSLAELDKDAPLGWRPTPVLLYLMDEQATRKSTPSRRPIPTQGRLLMRFLSDAVFGAESDNPISDVIQIAICPAPGKQPGFVSILGNSSDEPISS